MYVLTTVRALRACRQQSEISIHCNACDGNPCFTLWWGKAVNACMLGSRTRTLIAGMTARRRRWARRAAATTARRLAPAPPSRSAACSSLSACSRGRPHAGSGPSSLRVRPSPPERKCAHCYTAHHAWPCQAAVLKTVRGAMLAGAWPAVGRPLL
eukprot:2390879-Pleurochrysis_carterae.AAC.2